MFDEVIDPWVGASQGWGAISEEIPGMKFEALWAAPSLISVRWGDVGDDFLRRLTEIKHAVCIAIVYRGAVHGSVRATRDGRPKMRLWIPDAEAHTAFRGLKIAGDAMLRVGARFVSTGTHGTKYEMRSEEDTQALLNPKLRPRDLSMTANHVFGSCRMSGRPGEGAVDVEGRVRGMEGLYIADASIFPSPSAVNPQATIMALSDLITRRIAELDGSDAARVGAPRVLAEA
jgi:choline dehydrogenase-like flavoprotein